ncbi:MAG: flavin prenyltransferase UbiX [Candidatus Omnitrophota bacterium]|jgi:4-hydroxy-3-polyprenylbenzoate decarboxylase
MVPYVVAMTGASGAAYGIRLIRVLVELGHPFALVLSASARLVIREETGVALSGSSSEDFRALFGPEVPKHTALYAPEDFTAPIASGSYPTRGMMVVPCSMGSLGAIASGLSANLIHRAAACTLKEGRKLVLVPRETPLHAIHLENMLKLARLGVAIVPAMPAFYTGAKDLEGMIDFVVGKVLDQMGIAHGLYPRWTGQNTEHRLAGETA